MRDFIPYGRQDINEDDVNVVLKTLKSDFITQGPMITKFENEVARKVGAKYCSAMNSATSALHVACMALGVKEGDMVWTSPITFVASANCALYCGAEVDFVDIDERTFNLCPKKLEHKLEKAKKLGKLPKVLIPVHMAGQSCDMEKIHSLSVKYGFKIIEDASHAIGGKYNQNNIGACEFSDICVFSFHPVKIVTTGEGGACLTNSEELIERINLFRSHGITRDKNLLQNKNDDGPWYYEQQVLGYNYRITDIQAALGFSQLSRLEEYISKRHEIANTYFKKLKSLPIELPYQLEQTYSAYHLFIIKVDPKLRKKVFNKMRNSNIGVNVHYIPVHTQPYYSELGFRKGDFPAAEAYYESCISIPMYPLLTDDEIDYVCSTLGDIIR